MAVPKKQNFAFQEGDIWARDTVKNVSMYGFGTGVYPYISNYHLSWGNPDRHVNSETIRDTPYGDFYNITASKNNHLWGIIGVTYTTPSMPLGEKCCDSVNVYNNFLFLPSFTSLCGNSISAMDGVKKPQNAEYPALIDFKVVGFASQLLAYKRLAKTGGVTTGTAYKQHIIKSTASVMARYLTRQDKMYLNPYDKTYRYIADDTEVSHDISPVTDYNNDYNYFRPWICTTDGHLLGKKDYNKEEVLKRWYNFRYFGANVMLPKFVPNQTKLDAWVKKQWESLGLDDAAKFISAEQLIYDKLDEDTRNRLVLSQCFGDFYDWNDDYILDIKGVKCKVDPKNEKFLDIDTGEEIPFICVYNDDKTKIEYILTFKEYKSSFPELITEEDKQIQSDVVKALQDGTAMPSSQNCNPRPSMRKWTNILYYEPDRPDKIKEKEESLKTEEELAENPIEERQTRYTLWMGKYVVKYQYDYTVLFLGDYDTDFWGTESYNVYYVVYDSGEKDLYFTYDSLKENYDKVSNRFMYANSEDEALDKKEGTEKRKTFTGPLNIEEAIMLWLWDKMTFSLAEFSGNKNNGDLEYLPWLSTDEEPLFYYYQYVYLDGFTSKWKMMPSNTGTPYTRGETGKKYWYVDKKIYDDYTTYKDVFIDGPHQVLADSIEGANYCKITQIRFPAKDDTGYNQRQQYKSQTLYQYKSTSPITVDNLKSFNGENGEFLSWKYDKDWAGNQNDSPTPYTKHWDRSYSMHEILLEIFGIVTNLEGLDTTNALYDLRDTYFHQMNLTQNNNSWQTVDLQPAFTIYGVTWKKDNVMAEVTQYTLHKYIYDDEEYKKLSDEEKGALYKDINDRYYEIVTRGEPEYTLKEITEEEYNALDPEYRDTSIDLTDGHTIYYEKVFETSNYKLIELGTDAAAKARYDELSENGRATATNQTTGEITYYQKVNISLGQYYSWTAVIESDSNSVAAYNAAYAEDPDNVHTYNGVRYYKAKVTSSQYKIEPWVYETSIEYEELVKFSLPRRNVNIYIGHLETLTNLKSGVISGYVIKYKDTDGKTKVKIVSVSSSEYLYEVNDMQKIITRCLPLVPFYNYECFIQPFTIQHITIPNPDIFVFAAITAAIAASYAPGPWYAAVYAAVFIAFVLFYTIYILIVNGLFNPGLLGFSKRYPPILYYYYYDKKVNKYYKDAFNFYLLEWEKALNDNYTNVDFIDAEGKQVKVKMSRKLSRRFTNKKSAIYSPGILDKEDIGKVTGYSQDDAGSDSYAAKATKFGIHTALRFSFTMYFNKYFRKSRLIAKMGYKYLEYFYKQLNGQYGVWVEQQVYPPDRMQFPEKFRTLRFMRQRVDLTREGNNAGYYVVFNPGGAQFTFYCRHKADKFVFDIDSYCYRWRKTYFQQGEEGGKDTYNWVSYDYQTVPQRIESHKIGRDDIEPMEYTDKLTPYEIKKYGVPITKYTKSAEGYTYSIKTPFYKVPLTISYETEEYGIVKKEIDLFPRTNKSNYTVFYQPRNLDEYVWDEYLFQKIYNNFENRSIKQYLTDLILKKGAVEIADMYLTVFGKKITVVESVENMFNYHDVFNPINLVVSDADRDKFYRSDEDQLSKQYTFDNMTTWYTAELSRLMSKNLSDNYNSIQANITSDINDENIKGMNIATAEIVEEILTREIPIYKEDGITVERVLYEIPLNPYLTANSWKQYFSADAKDDRKYIWKLFTEDEIYDIGFYNYMVTDDPDKSELTLLIDKICTTDQCFLADGESVKKGQIEYNGVWLPLPVDIYKKFPIYCKNLIASMYFIQESYQCVCVGTVRWDNVVALRMYTAISIIGAIIMLIISIFLAIFTAGTSVLAVIAMYIAIIGSIVNIIGQLLRLIAVFFPTNISRKLQNIGNKVSQAGAIISAIGSFMGGFGGAGGSGGSAALMACEISFKLATLAVSITEKVLVSKEQKKRDKATARLKESIEKYNKSAQAVLDFIEENEFEAQLNEYQPINMTVKENTLFDDHFEAYASLGEGSYEEMFSSIDDYYDGIY